MHASATCGKNRNPIFGYGCKRKNEKICGAIIAVNFKFLNNFTKVRNHAFMYSY